MDENQNYEEGNISNELSNEVSTEVKPVKLGKKGVGLVLLVLVFIAILLCFCVRGCSIKKVPKEVTSSENSESSVSTEVLSSTENGTENSSINSEKSTFSEVPNSTSTEELTSTENEPIDNTDSFEQQGLVPTSEPVLSEPKESMGMVSDKNLYRIDNGYLYEARLIIVTNEGENLLCSYYCPRKTWDILYAGMSVNIVYQLDNEGNISIVSISE